jgi:WD40 repeat protein/serine/threonine protein kinase
MKTTPARRSSDEAVDSALARLVDDLIRRMQEGSPIDPSEFAAGDPRRAEQIRQLLPTLEKLADLGCSLSESAGAAPPTLAEAGPSLGVLGDFQLLSEVGRGGMGIVYEAQQLSLRRRVALKVLPFAAVSDPKQLQRFQVEAQAAAQLHHTNIVPVFGVGCERGVHYYAMQFIEGGTLARVISELCRLDGSGSSDEPQDGAVSALAESLASGRLVADGPRPADDTPTATYTPSPAPVAAPARDRSPTSRASSTTSSARGRPFFHNVAQLGIQAAEALEHAHQQGVLHRDIKPSNLLIDARGRLWVTDFGLARLQSDSSLTMTGDILGTLRYMSPEQALAKRVVIDHRTDIYSLGATLYELATLHSVFETDDRQELLRQVAFAEPRPLRKVNSAVPRELETIVLKAMAKDPSGRYATAQELADDLERFLDFKPIKAKPPSLPERLAKWSRRHTAAVWSAMAVLTLAVLGLSAGILMINRQKAETETARDEFKWQSYVQLVNAAYRRASDGEIEQAELLLFDCPRDLRGWEWHHVLRLCRRDRLTFRGHGQSVNALAISPDGTWVASASGIPWTDASPKDPAEVRFWDAESGREWRDNIQLTGAIQSLALTPDGRRLAVGGGYYRDAEWREGHPESRLSLWDVQTGGKLWEAEAEPDITVMSVSFLDGGKTLAAGYGWKDSKEVRGYVKFWDVSGEGVAELPNRFPGPVGGGRLAVHPDGRWVALAGVNGVEIWDRKEQIRLKAPTDDELWTFQVTFSPDGKWLASGGFDKVVRVWDTETWETPRELRGHRGFIRGLAFSHDSRTLASTGEDLAVWIWDVEAGKERGVFHGHTFRAVFDVAFFPGDRQLASAGEDWAVKIWDLAGLPVAFRGHEGWVSGVALHRDGRRVATESNSQDIRAAGGEFKLSDGKTRVWDPETGREEASGPLGMVSDYGPWGRVGVHYAVSPDRRWFAVGDPPNGVQIYETEPRRFVANVARELRPDGNIAFSADGKRLATTAALTVKLWDVETGREVFTLHGHGAYVICMAFSPGGASSDRLVSGSIDQTARVWDATPLTEDALREWEASWLVRRLFLRFPLKSELIEHLRNDPDLDEPLRAAALDAAEWAVRWEQPNRLATASAQITYYPDGSSQDYLRAVSLAEGALQLRRDAPQVEPVDARIRTALGIALYRVGRYAEARDHLLWADSHRKEPIPATGAFLAMTYHRLGEHDKARARLARTREELRSYRQSDKPTTQSFLKEAEALVEPRATK